ncbi:hypothetical protein ACIPRL_37465 [Streptomyces sp. NPDC090085]|uniref:hypothetical protein n=1 Tax=Streptomyces sp. NPDC090085 TaxID=3365943 RepID=UPI0038161856
MTLTEHRIVKSAEHGFVLPVDALAASEATELARHADALTYDVALDPDRCSLHNLLVRRKAGILTHG